VISLNTVIRVKPKRKQYQIEIKTDKGIKEYLVSEELLLEYRLVKGKELDDSTYQAFRSELEKDALYQKVLHFALYKPRCTNDIVEFMKRKQINPDQYKYHLNKLHKAHILDDQSYVNNFVSESVEFKRMGPNKIRFDLSTKHLNIEWIDSAIQSIPKKTIMANANLLAERKLASMKKQSVSKSIQQLKTFLVNKGYDFEIVNEVVNQHLSDIKESSDEEEAIQGDIVQAYRRYRNETTKKKEKILAYLLRKGYTYHTIKAKIGEYEDEFNDGT